MPWVREGYCCKCGDCCKGSVDGLPAQSDGACPYLSALTGTERLCTIHNTVNTYWAKGCNVFPTDPGQIHRYERCTYTFKWVQEDES
jgi:hypothetical protein